MKYLKIGMPLAAILLLLLAGIFLMVPEEKKEPKPVTQTAPEEEPEQEKEIDTKENTELEKLLTAFAEVIYTYDTNERRFYEGTDVYMTPEAYQAFIPFTEGEEPDSGPILVAMVSSLKKVVFYYRFFGESNVEVMMEARFRLSMGENGFLVQYMNLSAEKKEGSWKITACRIIDTIEQ